MKKFVAVAVLVLSLGACAQLEKVYTTVQVATVGVQNPVTPQDLYAIENGMIIAFAGLNAYKRVCVRALIDAQCKDVIRTLQVYTRQLPSLLANTRAFVKSGDQINARVAYSALLDIYNRFRSVAAANNVKVQ